MDKYDVLKFIKSTKAEKENRKVFPTFTLDVELMKKFGRLPRSELIDLYKSGDIKAGSTMNHKFFEYNIKRES